MDQQRIERVAALLVRARRDMVPLARLTEADRPASVAEAHAIQDAVSAALGKSVGAYKAMAPATGEPIRGVIYAEMIFPTPARVPAAQVPSCGVEGEVAFIYRRDLPPRGEPYTREEVSAAVDALAAIEVVHFRYADQTQATMLEKIADSIGNGAFVHAAPLAGWRGLDLGKLKVRLTVNGAVALEQVGGHPTGDPLGVAVALANMLRTSCGVRAAQFVTCGSCTGLRFLQPGDVCGVSFEGLGSAEVRFTQ